MIIDDFREILERYPNESRRKYKGNKFASKMRNEFKDDLFDLVFNLVDDIDDYKVKISSGWGSWTKRPWAGILNKTATDTFQRGLYLLYVFDFENNGIWLSLDQGTYVPNEEKLINISEYLVDIYEKSTLKAPDGFYSDDRTLYDETVLSKFYNINEIDYEEFKSDLKSLIEIYEYLIPYYNNYSDRSDVDLASNFREIFDKYAEEKTKPLKNNPFAEKMRNEFNDNFDKFVSNMVSDEYGYVTKISVGMGNWTTSPWADMRYDAVSESFQKGFYIFSWFDLENKILDMGLIQGKDKTTNELLKSRINYIHDKFQIKFPNFSDYEIGDYYIKLFSLSYDELTNDNMRKSFKDLINIYESLIPDYIDCLDSEFDGYGSPSNYWLYAPGENAFFWNDFYDEKIMGIGWNEVGNLKEYSNKDEIKRKLQEIYNDTDSHKNDVHCLWQFANEINVGDVVFAKKGMGEIVGVGFVESDYEFNENFAFNHVRKVNWVKKGNWSYDGKFAMKTLTNITYYHNLLENIKNLVGSFRVKPYYPKYTTEKFLEEVYIAKEDCITIRNLLKRKKNLIVQGPPGVGKTFMAKRLAYSMMGVEDENRVMMIQFHQSYSYEDFVMGYRPKEDGFELRDGSFYNFCNNAKNDPKNDYFFIIDEINRGNLSKIFGELFMLIEGDKRGKEYQIPLLYNDESFYIPENVYIIGLMNTADRSLAMMDYALRRRFAFFDLKPGFNSNGFNNYKNAINNETFDRLIDIITKLNVAISEDFSLGEGFTIGHSFLCNIEAENIEKQLSYVVDYEIIPLINEYWFDEPENIDIWSKELRSVFD